MELRDNYSIDMIITAFLGYVYHGDKCHIGQLRDNKPCSVVPYLAKR